MLCHVVQRKTPFVIPNSRNQGHTMHKLLFILWLNAIVHPRTVQFSFYQRDGDPMQCKIRVSIITWEFVCSSSSWCHGYLCCLWIDEWEMDGMGLNTRRVAPFSSSNRSDNQTMTNDQTGLIPTSTRTAAAAAAAVAACALSHLLLKQV